MECRRPNVTVLKRIIYVLLAYIMNLTYNIVIYFELYLCTSPTTNVISQSICARGVRVGNHVII